jgi:hypothetical protein
MDPNDSRNALQMDPTLARREWNGEIGERTGFEMKGFSRNKGKRMNKQLFLTQTRFLSQGK